MSLTRDRKDIIVVIILLSHGIYMNDNWRPDGMILWIWTWFGRIALVPPVSVKDWPLHWILVR